MFRGSKRKVAADASVRSWKAAFDADDSAAAAPSHAAQNPSPPAGDAVTETNEQNAARDPSECGRGRSRSRSRSRSRERRSGSPDDSPSRNRSRSPSTRRSAADDAGAIADHAPFAAAATFDGARSGLVFKLGTSGLGYYADVGSEQAALASELENFTAALRESAGVPGAASDPDTTTYGADAPIVAALASHRRAVGEAEAAADALVAVGTRQYGGRAGKGALLHDAQKLEVRRTFESRGLASRAIRIVSQVTHCLRSIAVCAGM